MSRKKWLNFRTKRAGSSNYRGSLFLPAPLVRVPFTLRGTSATIWNMKSDIWDMKYPTIAHFRHFSHFRHSFNYNIFPDTLYFNKQTQLTKCPNRLKLFYNNELCKYYQSDESQKQSQTNPIKAKTKPIQTQFAKGQKWT